MKKKGKEKRLAVPSKFQAVIEAFAKDKRIRLPGAGRGFGSRALRVNDKIFAMISRKDQFVVKLPTERAQELVRNAQGAYFDPGHGRPMKEWVVILSDHLDWVDLAREACRFVQHSA